MTANSNLTGRLVATAMLAVVFFLMLLVHLVSPPAAGMWMQIFADSVHVPIFGIVGLCLFVAAGTAPNVNLAQRAGFAIGVTWLLGAISEAAQIPGPRHASLEDLLADWLGAASFVLIVSAIKARAAYSRPLRAGLAVLGLALLVVALAPLLRVSAAYAERNIRVPTLVSFDAHFVRRFILTQHASLKILDPPPSGAMAAEIRLGDGPWPGIIIHDVWPDWSEYSTLVIKIAMPDDLPLDLNIRVHDRMHRRGRQPHNDRYNLEYTLQPGHHTLRLPVSQIMSAPANRDMNMSEIEGIVLYCSAQNAGRRFWLESIALE